MVIVFSLDLSWLAPLAIVFGVVVYLSRSNERAGQIGRIVLGLGADDPGATADHRGDGATAQAAGVKYLSRRFRATCCSTC